MARDHALALALARGAAALRVYRWAPPTVSLGRNEPARGLYDLGAAAARGLDFVRRPTGGRAVLHDRELTYAVAVPVGALGGLRETYRRVNAGLVRALRGLGVPAALADDGAPAVAPDAGACFRRAARGEVTVGGRKLVGSAQVRLGAALLQHGSLLLGPGQELIEAVRTGGSRGAGAAPASLGELLGGAPPWDRLVDGLIDGLRSELGGRWAREERREASDGRVGALESRLERRYRSEAWTWRR